MKHRITVDKITCDHCKNDTSKEYLTLQTCAGSASYLFLKISYSSSDKNLIKAELEELHFCNKECFKKWIDGL